MQYQRDFTIGVKETQDFYVSLQLKRWQKGILGFGAVGVLTAWLYLGMLVPALEGQSPAQAAAALCRAGLNIKAAGPTQSGAAKAAWQSAPAGASLPAGSLVEVRFFESDPEGD